MKRVVLYILIFLFGMVIMIDPTGQLLNLKEVLFISLILVSILTRQYGISNKEMRMVLLLFFYAFLSIITGFVIFQSDLSESMSYFKALFIVFLIIPLSNVNIKDIIIINYYIGLILSVYISFLYIGMIFGNSLATYLIPMLEQADHTLMIAKRPFLNYDGLMFFYKTMPFCFFAFIYALRHNYIFQAMLIFFSISIGLTRTPILMSMTIVAYVLYTKNNRHLQKIIGLAFFILILYLLIKLLDVKNSQSGDEVKYATVIELFNNSSIFGHGVGCLYKSTARGDMVTNSEMTYFEMLYHYGWLLFPFVMWLFLKPIKKMFYISKDYDVKDFYFAYLLYLVNAGTNPLLINSTGLYVYACALVLMGKNKIYSQRRLINNYNKKQ